MLNPLSLITAVSFSIYAIIVLFMSKQGRGTRFLLSLMFFCLALELFDIYAINNGLISKSPYILKISHIFSVLIGMSFYHFMISILSAPFKFSPKTFLHFIPSIILLVIYVVFKDQSKLLELFPSNNTSDLAFSIERGINLAINMLMIAYFFATFRALKRIKWNLEDNFSTVEQVEILWLIRLTISLMVCFIFNSAILFFIDNTTLLDNSLVIVLTSVFVISLFRSITKPKTITDFSFIIENKCLENSSNKGSIDEPFLENDELLDTYDALKVFVEKEKVYCIPRLSLQQLAEKMGVKKYLLSQAINKYAGQNYFTFINTYRIEEAKRKLSDDTYNKDSIESIGLCCGFNSSSSFFLVFKRIVGETPTEYRNKAIELSYKVRM